MKTDDLGRAIVEERTAGTGRRLFLVGLVLGMGLSVGLGPPGPLLGPPGKAAEGAVAKDNGARAIRLARGGEKVIFVSRHGVGHARACRRRAGSGRCGHLDIASK